MRTIRKLNDRDQTTACNYYRSKAAHIACLSFEGELVGPRDTAVPTLIDKNNCYMMKTAFERAESRRFVSLVWATRVICPKKTWGLSTCAFNQKERHSRFIWIKTDVHQNTLMKLQFRSCYDWKLFLLKVQHILQAATCSLPTYLLL